MIFKATNNIVKQKASETDRILLLYFVFGDGTLFFPFVPIFNCGKMSLTPQAIQAEEYLCS